MTLQQSIKRIDEMADYAEKVYRRTGWLSRKLFNIKKISPPAAVSFWVSRFKIEYYAKSLDQIFDQYSGIMENMVEYDANLAKEIISEIGALLDQDISSELFDDVFDKWSELKPYIENENVEEKVKDELSAVKAKTEKKRAEAIESTYAKESGKNKLLLLSCGEEDYLERKVQENLSKTRFDELLEKGSIEDTLDYLDLYEKEKDIHQRAAQIRKAIEKQKQETKPKLVKPYDLSKLIRNGELSDVYLAADNRKTPCIHQQLKFKWSDKESVRNRFIEAAKTWDSLVHENIVSCLDFYVSNASYPEGDPKSVSYIVAELPGDNYEFLDQLDIKNQGLSGFLKNRAKTMWLHDNAANIIRQIARALGYAHKRNIVHGSVTPSDIICSQNTGQAKLANFGLNSVLFNAGLKSEIPYRAVYPVPDEWHCYATEFKPHNDSPQEDIYSLGLVFFELLSGKKCKDIPLFGFFERLQKELKVPDNKYSGILQAMLQSDADKRPTAGEVARTLADMVEK
jgi:hypothetical protein